MNLRYLLLILFCNFILASEVTFQVDMNDELIENGVYLVGTWDYTFHQMNQEGSTGIYTYIESSSINSSFTEGGNFQYWFALGNSWGDNEIIERYITVTSVNTVLDVVCFNSLESCPEDIEFSVELTFIDENETWNNIWFTTSNDGFLTPFQGINNGDGIWTFTANYSPSTYEWGVYQASDDIGTQEIWLTPNNPNLSFTISNDGDILGETNYTLQTYPVIFTIIDGTFTFEDIFINLGSADFAYPNWGVQIPCDNNDGNHVWICEISLEPSESIYWKAFEGGGTELNGLIGLGNLIFSLSDNGIYNSELTTLNIPDLGVWVTNTVIFSVDMTDWLDEVGSTGIPIFSVARNDEVQVRGDWNNWSDGNSSISVLVNQPGTNIFSLPVELSGFSEAAYTYKFYIKHTSESIVELESRYGPMEELDWGWEDSPIYGGGNRVFTLSTPSGSTTLLEEGYYDISPGGVIPLSQNLSLTFSIDMSQQSDYALGNNVSLVLRDKWTNYIQGFAIAAVLDNNPIAKFNADCNSDICDVTINLIGPFPWHVLYTWEYKNNDNDLIREGGEFGTYGKYRARYIQPNDNGIWSDYILPRDIFQKDPPYIPEVPPICPDDGDVNGDGGWNVLDIVLLANWVLDSSCSGAGPALNCCAGDMNQDTGWNVLDVVALANCVLDETCGLK